MSPTYTVELSVRDLDPEEVVELWQRMNLVAEGFLRDGREVQVSTYRFTDEDEVEVLAGPPEDGATR